MTASDKLQKFLLREQAIKVLGLEDWRRPGQPDMVGSEPAVC
jgi:hypothetical protein